MSQPSKGFTLIELITTIAVAAILAAIAIPSFATILKNNAMVTTNNKILAALNFTRSSAITNGASATLCKSNAQSTDCDSTASWEDGWIVFNDTNGNAQVDTNEVILNVYQGIKGDLTISYRHSRLVYNNDGFSMGYAGVFLLCDSRGNSAKKGIIISSNGRPRKGESSEINSSCPTS
ncbi:MAG: GspH/FimT family protein [Cocleimonas sp.]|nr:GspH/FimT family protein [Cocleimonas sp.]